MRRRRGCSNKGRPCGFGNVVVVDHPFIQTKLTELRGHVADHCKFRTMLDEIAGLIVYEVMREPMTGKVLRGRAGE